MSDWKLGLKNALAFWIAQNHPVRVNRAPAYRGIETGGSIAPDSEWHRTHDADWSDKPEPFHFNRTPYQPDDACH